MSADKQAELIGVILREHQPATGMIVASGMTCRCGYWNGEEVAGRTRPVGYQGLQWHQAQMIAAAMSTPETVASVEPSDADWGETSDDYREAGWEDEPGDQERMFFEAGFRMGRDRVASLHPIPRTDVLAEIRALHGPGRLDHRISNTAMRYRCRACGRSWDVNDDESTARPCPTVAIIEAHA